MKPQDGTQWIRLPPIENNKKAASSFHQSTKKLGSLWGHYGVSYGVSYGVRPDIRTLVGVKSKEFGGR